MTLVQQLRSLGYSVALSAKVGSRELVLIKQLHLGTPMRDVADWVAKNMGRIRQDLEAERARGKVIAEAALRKAEERR